MVFSLLPPFEPQALPQSLALELPRLVIQWPRQCRKWPSPSKGSLTLSTIAIRIPTSILKRMALPKVRCVWSHSLFERLRRSQKRHGNISGEKKCWKKRRGSQLANDGRCPPFFYFLDPCIFWILIDQHVPLATGLRYFNIRWHDYQSGGLFRCWALGDFQK